MKIALLGDLAPFGRYCLHKSARVKSQFTELAGFLRTHDVVVANLETPFADGDRCVGSKSAHIHAHPSNLELLKHLGVTHVTLGNNHVADYGLPGYTRTKALLDSAGIGWFGSEGQVLRLERGNDRVALIGYCSLNTNPLVLRTALGTAPNLLDVDNVVGEMARASKDGYLPILAIHSGQEHVHLPSSEDVEFARSLAACFRYIYYGHHPHVVQGVEEVDGSVILYSLGNIIFDDVYTPRNKEQPLIKLSQANKTGLIASINVHGNAISDWRVLPMYLGDHNVQLGEDVSGFDIEDYNRSLIAVGTTEYDNQRREQIESYFSSRRALRNLKWYISRLNFNSVGILIGARKNAHMHSRMFTEKLPKLKGRA